MALTAATSSPVGAARSPGSEAEESPHTATLARPEPAPLPWTSAATIGAHPLQAKVGAVEAWQRSAIQRRHRPALLPADPPKGFLDAGITSGDIDDFAPEVPPAPVSVSISAIGAAAPVRALGVAADGTMALPDNVTDVAWYGHGPSPGEAGSAVLAAHVDLAGQGPGIFFALGDLDEGDMIDIGFDDGSSTRFAVVEVERIEKTRLDTERLFRRHGAPTLTLITCGGGFDAHARHYDSNVIAHAVPLEGAAP